MAQRIIVTIIVILAAGWIGSRLWRWARLRFGPKTGGGGCGHGCRCGKT